MERIDKWNPAKVAEVEGVTFPMVLQDFSLDLLIPNLVQYTVELFQLSGIDDIKEKDLSVSHFSYKYMDVPWYVTVIRFPLALKEQFTGCFRRGFIVHSPMLRGVHYFGEVLTEWKDKFKLQYFQYIDEGVLSYDVLENTSGNDNSLAFRCLPLAYGQEQNGVAGRMFGSFCDIKAALSAGKASLV